MLSKPELFPHRIDLAADKLTFVQVARDDIRSNSFLDGRVEFWQAAASPIRLSELSCRSVSPGLDRFIFHVGFCGSTLMSRLLDRPGGALALREPRLLTDLAAYRAGLDAVGDDDARVEAALIVARRLLRRRWETTEIPFIKPSNWVNNLIPALCADPSSIRPLFLSMERRSFVRAVVRGGSDRLAFTARAAVHFSTASESGAIQIATLLREECDELDKLLALAVLAHRFQSRLFADACREGGWSDRNRLSFEELRDDVEAAGAKAAAALELDWIPATGSDWSAWHAKCPNERFHPEAERAADARVEASFGDRIDAAIARYGTE